MEAVNLWDKNKWRQLGPQMTRMTQISRTKDAKRRNLCKSVESVGQELLEVIRPTDDTDYTDN